MALRRHIALLACVAHRAQQSAEFVALGHLLREIIANSGSYYGVTGPIGQLGTFGDTFTGSDGTKTPHCTFACVAHRAEQVCQVSSLWVTYSER
ncbi:hypothetical protein DPMN_092437 [Dreissena polymorpha]|uniref:Uncharacterized protein n=1 Tax=Dreissena polymorpha TaxID=45954 RepID=A0A9D4L3N2_DREPO|nr:hypothetical protein DPMN_092437 [Dreissena polymorpha]